MRLARSLPAVPTLRAPAVLLAFGALSACGGGGGAAPPQPPAAPVLLSTSPRSPANLPDGGAILLAGRAAPASSVALFPTPDCTGAPVAAVAAAALGADGSFQVQLAVPPDSTTSFSAKATGANGLATCSTQPLVFVEDSTAPALPVLGTSPGSPSRTLHPIVGTGPGATEPGATAHVYFGPGCLAPAGEGVVAPDGHFAVEVTVGVGETVTFSAEVVDGAGNRSGCTPESDPWVQDSLAPDVRTPGTTPASPANDNQPVVTGATDPEATVRLYADAACAVEVASGTADANGLFAIPITVGDDTTTVLHLVLVDLAGNVSACLAGPTYVEDSTPPGVPFVDATDPASPSPLHTVTVTGRAEPGAAVTLHDAACDAPGLAAPGLADAGGHWSIRVTALPDAHTTRFVALATDAAGNASACSQPLDFVQSAPPPPRLVSATPGSPANLPAGGAVALAGQAAPNGQVDVFTSADCSTTPQRVAAGADGAFTVSVVVAQDATTSIAWTDTTPDGTSACTLALDFVEDSQPPALPTLAFSPASPSNALALRVGAGPGATEAGATARVYLGAGCVPATRLGEAPVQSDGSFAVEVTVPARNATYTFSADVVDGAGNGSGCTAPSDPWVQDSLPPALADGAMLPAGPANDNTPGVTGLTEPFSFVEAFTDPTCTPAGLAGSGGADDLGRFAIPVTVLDDSVTTFYVRILDLAGNPSTCLPGPTYVEDSTGPAGPVLETTSPASPSNSRTITVAGQAEPNATVTVFDGSCDGAPFLGAVDVPVDAAGHFSAVLANLRVNTVLSLVARATDVAGNPGACGAPLLFEQDSLPPAAPAVATSPGSPSRILTPVVGGGPGATEPGATVAVFLSLDLAARCAGAPVGIAVADDSGAYQLATPVTMAANRVNALTARATDRAGNPGPCLDPPFEYEHDGLPPAAPTFSGTSPAGPANENAPVVSGRVLGPAALPEANALVELFGDPTCSGPVLGSGGTAADGTFAIAATVADDTTTTFRAHALDLAGNTGPCSGDGPTYVEDSTPPPAPAVTASSPTSPSRFGTVAISGTATGGAATVDLYRDAACGGVPLNGSVPVPVTAGAWTFTDPAVLRNQTVSYTARARDAAKNLSACSAPFSFTHDDLAPGAPTIGSTPASPSNQATITLGGAAETDATVRVWAAAGCTGTELTGGSRKAANGAWTFDVTPPADAVTTYSANATDPAGNPSACSAAFSFTQDATPPDAPVLVAITPPGGPSNNPTPTVDGTGEKGATIRIHAGTCAGAILVTGAVLSDGTFRVFPPVPRNTTTTLVADLMDPATNVSACSNGFTYQHDDVPPVFGGLVSAEGIDDVAGPGLPPPNQAWIRLAWAAATDGVTPASALVYDVCRGTRFGECLTTFVPTYTSAPGQTTLVVAEDRGPHGNRYFYVVRARDAAGNRDPNAVERSARAFSSGAVATASGAGFTCVLDAGGRVTCEAQTLGAPQEGTGGFLGPVRGFPAGVGAVALSAGEQHACALGSNGGVYCWGGNASGQLGLPLATATWDTASEVSLPSPARAIGCGRDSTCAVLQDGRVACWGKNDAGQLGVAASAPRPVPVSVTGLDGFTAAQVAVGDQHACALATDGSIQCWGRGAEGQLGNSDVLADVVAPAALFRTGAAGFDPNGFVGVVAGWAFTCGWTSTGDAWCAGANDVGQLGDGTGGPGALQGRPVQVGGAVPLNGVKRLAAGAHHACALFFAGSTSCWGDDAAAQQGNGETIVAPQLEPGQVFTPAGALVAGLSLFAGSGDETCVVVDGVATCWGTGRVRSGGDLAVVFGLTLPAAGTGLAAGRNHSCAVQGDGELRCFGQGIAGQLGGGFAGNSSVPLEALTSVGAVAAGGDVTAAEGSSFGEAWTWGSNSHLQLGDTTENVVVTQRNTVGSVQLRWPFALSEHGCATFSDSGLLNCWGRNDRGQVGNGSAGADVARGATTAGTQALKAVGLATGRLHTCALGVDGTVQCWGDNVLGQLGGASGAQLSPNRQVVGGLFDAVQVSGAGDTTCARFGDGTVQCWGANARGQAGLGDTVGQSLPGTVLGLSGAADLAVGARHACAARADGTVWCWGANESGQLGDGTAADRSAPVQVTGLAGVKRVVAGDAHTCALRYDGTLRCWGGDGFGQLGDGAANNAGPSRGTPGEVVAFP